MLLSETTLTLNRIECRALLHNVPGIPIVFLHGYSFTSDIWNDIGVLKFLERKNIPFLALDMPYGLKSRCSRKTRNPDINVHIVRQALEHMDSDEPVLVGASLGGYIAMNYAITHPLRGLLIIAPVNTQDESLTQQYPALNIPVHIIYGTHDTIVGRSEMETLDRQLGHSKLIIYENAPHPAYLHDPESFKTDLLELYDLAIRSVDRSS